MKEILFAYGTLMADHAPVEMSAAINRLIYLGNGFIYGKLYDTGEFPAAKLDSTKRSKVFGKIYQLPAEASVLSALDKYEEYYSADSPRNLFIRKKAHIYSTTGLPRTGWVYEYNRDVIRLPLIKSGDFSTAASQQ